MQQLLCVLCGTDSAASTVHALELHYSQMNIAVLTQTWTWYQSTHVHVTCTYASHMDMQVRSYRYNCTHSPGHAPSGGMCGTKIGKSSSTQAKTIRWIGTAPEQSVGTIWLSGEAFCNFEFLSPPPSGPTRGMHRAVVRAEAGTKIGKTSSTQAKHHQVDRYSTRTVCGCSHEGFLRSDLVILGVGT